MDAAGRVLARRRLPEGVAGMARLHELIGLQLGEDAEDAEVVIGIETDRGPWVAALVAAGYIVYAVNPLQASRYRERHGVVIGQRAGGRCRAGMWLMQERPPGAVVRAWCPKRSEEDVL